MSCYTINSLFCRFEGTNNLVDKETNSVKTENQQILDNEVVNTPETNINSSLNVWDIGFNLSEQSNDCGCMNRNMFSCNNYYANNNNNNNNDNTNLKFRNEPFVIPNNNMNVKNCNNDNNNKTNDDLGNKILFGTSLEKRELNDNNNNTWLNSQFGNVQLPFNNNNNNNNKEKENNTYYNDSHENEKSVKTFRSFLSKGSFFSGNRNEFWLGSSLHNNNTKNLKKTEKKKVYEMKFKQYNPKKPSPLHISNSYTELSESYEEISCDTDSSKELDLFSFNPFNTMMLSLETSQKSRKIGNIFNSFNNSLKTDSNKKTENKKETENANDYNVVPRIDTIFSSYNNKNSCPEKKVVTQKFEYNSKIRIEEEEEEEEGEEEEEYSACPEDENENRSTGSSNSADSTSSNEGEAADNGGYVLSDESNDVLKYEGFFNITNSPYDCRVSDLISPLALSFDTFGRV